MPSAGTLSSDSRSARICSPRPTGLAMASPSQTGFLSALLILLPIACLWSPSRTLTLTTETLMRISDVLWNEGRIRISKRWAKGKDGETKTEASDGYVPLHPILAAHLRAWRGQSPYAKDGDFVFPSLKARGRVPLSASVFVADHLRPAAKKAGVPIEDGQRFGRRCRKAGLSADLMSGYACGT